MQKKNCAKQSSAGSLSTAGALKEHRRNGFARSGYTGYVDTFFDKVAAGEAVKSVYGVKAMTHDIEVKLRSARTDSEIVTEAVQAPEHNGNVPHKLIKVLVKKGWLTLEGKVDWAPPSRLSDASLACAASAATSWLNQRCQWLTCTQRSRKRCGALAREPGFVRTALFLTLI